MKKSLLFTLICLISFCSFSQSSFSDIPLGEKEDYKAAEPDVIKAVNYLFNSKYDKDDLERLYAIEFVMKWMGGTPDYTFELHDKLSKPFIGETDLVGLYMAAMAKYALQNKATTPPATTVGLNAVKMIIEYSNKPSNNLKQTSEMKKIASAMQKGSLEKYFGL